MSDYLVNPGNAGNITGDLGTLFTDDNTQYRSNVMGSNGGAGVKNMIIASTDATGNVNIGMNEPTLDAGTATIPIDNLTIVTGAVFSPQSGKIAVKETLKMSGGLIGKSAYTFDGSSGYISAGDSADGTYGNRNIFAGGGTVEIWFNAASHGENTAGRLIQKTRTIGSDVGWRLNMDGSNKLYFRQDFSSAAGIWKTPASTVVFGKWHHFAVTYDNGDVANDPTFYLDGKVIAAEEDNTPVGSYESDSGQGMYIGNQDFNSGNTFDGTIAMVRIFTDIRTQAELRTDMFNNKAGMSSTHLLARMYQFDEGTGAALENVADAAGTTGDATISGSAWAAVPTFGAGGDGDSSTITFDGTQSKLYYRNDQFLYNLTVNTGKTLTLHGVHASGAALRPRDTLAVTGTLNSNGSEWINLENAFAAAGPLTVGTPATSIAGLYKLAMGHTSGTINLPACTTKRLDHNQNGTTKLIGPVTLTDACTIDNGILDIDSQTLTAGSGSANIIPRFQNGATCKITGGTMKIGTSGTSSGFTFNTVSSLTATSATIQGYSSSNRAKCKFRVENGLELVGTAKDLEMVSDSDTHQLTVIGPVINCTVNNTDDKFIQWHHTLDTQQLLDADSGGDDDLKLERPALDNALELMTG